MEMIFEKIEQVVVLF